MNIMDTILGILLVVITLKVSRVALDCQNSNYNITYGEYHFSNTFNIINPPIGRRMCINECQKYTQCKAVNHLATVMGCMLMHNTSATVEELKFEDGWTNIQLEKTVSGCTDNERLVTLHNGQTKCIVDSKYKQDPKQCLPSSSVCRQDYENGCEYWPLVGARKCDILLTINNIVYPLQGNAIGTRVYLVCEDLDDGYISLGCTYICKATGRWEIIENKGWIKISNTTGTWEEARDACAADNATLLIIEDSAYFDDVTDKVTSSVSDMEFSVSCGSPKYDFWIGLSDIETEGTFKWVNGDNFTSWDMTTQKFDDTGCDGVAADCVVISTDDGTWNDRNCVVQQPFICQKT